MLLTYQNHSTVPPLIDKEALEMVAITFYLLYLRDAQL